LRREIGIIVRDSKVVNALIATFEHDWETSGFEETSDAAKTAAPSTDGKAKATRALEKQMSPLKSTLKKAIKQAVTQAGKEVVTQGDLKSTVKGVVKTAVKEAVKEIVDEVQGR
jgi:uncharacterized membrane-anchored protein YjiN (DUF445 family)